MFMFENLHAGGINVTLSTKQKSVLILAFSYFAYLFSYLGRNNYSTCILQIVNDTGISRAVAGSVTAAFSICYAFGQLTTGFVIKKLSPVKVISFELITTAVINFIFPSASSFSAMLILWATNGIIQSTILCSLTQIFVDNLKEPYLSKSAVLINTIGAVGGFLNYFIAWALLKYSVWQSTFLLSSILLFTFGIVWIFIMPKISQKFQSTETVRTLKDENRHGFLSQIKKHGAFAGLLACLSVGALREGVALWIPSYINDSFNIDAATSTFLTVFVPMLQIIGAFLSGTFARKFYNLHIGAIISFIVSSLCMMCLFLFGNASVYLTIFLFTCNSIAVTCGMSLYLSFFPLRFFDKNFTARVVGLSSFFIHTGDFLASIGIGYISESGSWSSVFASLFSIATFAVLISVLGNIAHIKGEKNG